MVPSPGMSLKLSQSLFGHFHSSMPPFPHYLVSQSHHSLETLLVTEQASSGFESSVIRSHQYSDSQRTLRISPAAAFTLPVQMPSISSSLSPYFSCPAPHTGSLWLSFPSTSSRKAIFIWTQLSYIRNFWCFQFQFL